MFCTECGAENIDEARFCHACGAELDTGKPSDSGQPPLKPGTTKITPIAIQKAVDPLVGGELAGCKIFNKLGQGGMGTVYRGLQLGLGRPVAIKVLFPTLSKNPQYVERFFHEAQTMALVRSENIVQVHDAGELGGMLYIIMEFVEGRTLYEVLHETKVMHPAKALEIVEQVAVALADAAAHGIIHRDIKPDNIMLTDAGQTKVADFGIAKNVEEGALGSRAGFTIGTPAYMSPEQCEGKATDHRSDIYSLGVTFYTMVTGRIPFNAENSMAIMMKHITAPAESPRKFNPNVSFEMETVIKKMMAKQPSARHQDPQELLDALRGLKGAAAAPVEKSKPPPPPRPIRIKSKPRSTSGPRGIILLILLLIIAAGVWLMAFNKDGTRTDVRSIDQSAPDKLLKMGEQFVKQGKYKEAMNMYETLKNLDPPRAKKLLKKIRVAFPDM
jgi:serine/threonine protein kinase